MRRLLQLDRRLGRAVRSLVGRLPGGRSTALVIARVMSPAFRLAVALMILRRRTRATGLRCLGAGVAAGMTARVLRDRLGRPRPGDRAEGGLPSRHAAASAAIARTAAEGAPRAGRVLAAAAVVGMVARVAAAEHDPADIAAGAALGLASARAVALVAAAPRGRPGA
ncbi:MAG TPA: phosphatase PAP2 family protein [Miltoncostaea sp.]|nr:phosphatase PAP2 family protein [Miltoncostaea sp.]